MTRARGFLLDLGVALLALLLVEWGLQQVMAPLAARNRALNEAPAAPPAGLAAFHAIWSRTPAALFAELRALGERPLVVFVGDSQGMVVKDRAGLPFPQEVARLLAERSDDRPVASLHLGGANTSEQGTLLLGMLEAGVVPRAVFWAHSLFSLRKNEIRAELVPLYQSLPAADTGRPAVILVGGAAEPDSSLPAAQRALQALSARLDEWYAASAAVRFSRRELWEKAQLLSASPPGALLPAGLRARTGEQVAPAASILEGSAAFAGQVTGVLRRRGVRVVDFLTPIDRTASPRPLAAASEAVAYPALERAVRAHGGEYVSWIDLLPGDCYGRFEDGTKDAFHIAGAGHARLARRIVETLETPPAGR